MAVFLVKCKMAPSVVSEGAEEEIKGGKDWMSCHNLGKGCFPKIGVFPPEMDGENNGNPY